MLRRIFLIALGMVSILPIVSAAPSLSEVFAWALGNNIITARESTDTSITREDAAGLFLSVAKKYWGADAIDTALKNVTTPCKFGDVADTNNNIMSACALGIIRGDANGNYNPSNKLTPAQAMTILMRIVGGKQDESSNPWWNKYYDIATRNNIIPTSDKGFISTATEIGRGKILSWIYDLMESPTIRNDEAVKNMSASLFGTSEFTTGVKSTGATSMPQVTTPVVTSSAVGLCANNDSWYCHWFAIGSHSGSWSWIWWLIALWLLWKLWKWLSGCGNSEEDGSGVTHIQGTKRGMQGHDNSSKAFAATGTRNQGTGYTHDDLEIIEGIGPKVAEILRKNGITTFEELADMTPSAIAALLEPHGHPYSAMSTDTWPEQAALARDGEMAKLEKLKEKLDGGRRV